MKHELINEIQKVVLKKDENSVYSKVLSIIEKMIYELKSNVKIIAYDVVKDFFSIELLDEESLEHFDIDVSMNNIEIRGDGYELIYFFDDSLFASKCDVLMFSFFSGRYTVISYLGEDHKKEAFGIIWKDEDLAHFNNEREGVRFFKSPIVSRITRTGLNMIGPV